jgi:hypothetical protein
MVGIAKVSSPLAIKFCIRLENMKDKWNTRPLVMGVSFRVRAAPAALQQMRMAQGRIILAEGLFPSMNSAPTSI